MTGINGGESQALAFGDESLWLARLMWAELHGEILVRWQWDETVRMVRGALMTDSKGIYDAATNSESPQLGLRSARGGTELEAAVEQCRQTETMLKWSNGGAMLAESGAASDAR